MVRALSRRLSAAAFALLAALAPPGADAQSEPAREPARDASHRELVIGMTQFPSTMHPHIDAMLAKSYVNGMVNRPITTYSPEWELICMLCVELPTLENGLAEIEPLPEGVGPEGEDEGVALRVTLHPEATWGDGTPVTADDVIFTWEAAIDRIDDKTFVMHVDRVTFAYNGMSGWDLLPAHIERPIFEASPGEYRNRTAYDRDPDNPGLYSGPYRIAHIESGSHIVLEPNPTWHGKAPYFERIVVRVIGNTAALEANLLSGAIDYIAGELGLTVDQAFGFEARHPDAYEYVYEAGLIYEHIDLNLDNPILADRRVRRALILGIDRRAISEHLFAGRQPVAHSMVSPLDWIATDDIPKYAHDPAAAGRLLDAAGWDRWDGGFRHNAEGERLTLSIMTTAGNRSREMVEQVLQSHWREVGIDVAIRNEPARVFFGQTVSKRRFPAMAMFAWISAPESVPRTTLHSEMIPTEENGWRGQNYTGFRSDEADRLIDAIERELDRDRRFALWQELQALYATELPAIPLYFRANAYILPKWLEGLEPTGHQFPSTLWVEHWRAAPES